MYVSPRFLRNLALAILGLTTTLPNAAAATPSELAGGCRTGVLPVPVGTLSSQVNGGDRAARFLVGEAFVDGRGTVALQWHGNAVHELDPAPLAPFIGVTATDVNGSGVVVGNKIVDFSTFRSEAWVYRNGRFRLLSGLTTTDETFAAAINSRGDIIGTSQDSSANPVVRRAVIWPADRPGTVRELTVAGTPSRSVRGVDIDDDGTALGFLGDRPTETQRPYVWPASGSPYTLEAPSGAGYPEGVAIRSGWVAGTVFAADGNSAVVRWDLRTRAGRIVSTSSGTAFAVNRHGTVAANGALIHRTGRTADLGADAKPTVLADGGTAAGSIATMGVRWFGC